MKYTDRDIRYLDITRETAVSYWNALLTANTILIAIFAVVAVTDTANRWIVVCIVLLSFISATLLIMNFNALLSFYRMIGPIQVPEFEAMTEEKKQDVRTDAEAEYNRITSRESLVTRLLYVQAVSILLLFLNNLLQP